MGNRLTKIYTRTGDDGNTGMANGERVAKDSAVIAAIGDVDELNSYLGMVLTHSIPEPVEKLLLQIQQQLFDIGGELSRPEFSVIGAENVTWLELQLDSLNKDLPPLKEFILPGGGPAAVTCHVARAVCRRAERHLVTWQREFPGLNPYIIAYINRLSDLLFVICRVLSRDAGEPEVFWQPGKV